MRRFLPRLLVLPVIAAVLSVGSAAHAATGDFVKEFAGSNGGNEFQDAYFVEVDRDGFVFVTDRATEAIQKFKPGGKYVATLGDVSVLSDPYSTAVDRKGKLYVADQNESRC